MDSITIRLLDPPRASLESPLSLKCCKNVGGTRNGRWCGTREPLRTHYPGKGRLRGLVLAASTDEEATSSSQVGGIDLEKAVQERLRKAQEYKTKKGAASTAQDGTVPPPSAPKVSVHCMHVQCIACTVLLAGWQSWGVGDWLSSEISW